MENEKLSAMKNPMYMSFIEMDLLAIEHTARLTFCFNAQNIKLFNWFSVTNKGFLTSKSFLA